MNPLLFGLKVVGIIYSIVLHEIAHGGVAYLFGDDTARRSDRLTLNPLPHIDPIGTIFLPAILILTQSPALFGWAKPVPVNYNQLNRSRLGIIAVALAGCITNFLLACIAIACLHIPAIAANVTFREFFQVLAGINIILCAFNLIPIPPLDGSKVVMSFLPYETQLSLSRLEPYGFFILILLMMAHLLDPVVHFMASAVYGLISLIFGG
jgi:Zn-dependent protease